tara:strand:+ start:124 stop:474 length:351 start_codon:yes stop_codon:yes gene_type:complete
MFSFAVSISFVKAEQVCTPVFGKLFKHDSEGKDFNVVRADFNCNGVIDTVIAKRYDTTTTKFDVYAYSDLNENGKMDITIRFRPNFLILYIDTDEDGKDDVIGYDYNYDLIIDELI